MKILIRLALHYFLQLVLEWCASPFYVPLSDASRSIHTKRRAGYKSGGRKTVAEMRSESDSQENGACGRDCVDWRWGAHTDARRWREFSKKQQSWKGEEHASQVDEESVVVAFFK